MQGDYTENFEWIHETHVTTNMQNVLNIWKDVIHITYKVSSCIHFD